MAVPTFFQLNTGARMPAIGLGTWKSHHDEVKNAVSYALQNGYTLIDTGYCYDNEAAVGEGIKEALAAGIKREDIFVVTKAWPSYLTRIEQALEMSCNLLGLDYVDMYLVHWPVLLNPEGNDEKFPLLPDGTRDVIFDYPHTKIWSNMEQALKTGKTKAIGVCNYSKSWLQELLATCTVVPAINQIELHPALPQQDVVDYCAEQGIHVMAYSPLGSTGGSHLAIPPVVEIAKEKGVTPAVILISYHLARGSTVLPKSVTPSRIKANLEVVHLNDEDMRRLREYGDELTEKGELRRMIFPPWKTNFGFPDKS